MSDSSGGCFLTSSPPNGITKLDFRKYVKISFCLNLNLKKGTGRISMALNKLLRGIKLKICTRCQLFLHQPMQSLCPPQEFPPSLTKHMLLTCLSSIYIASSECVYWYTEFSVKLQNIKTMNKTENKLPGMEEVPATWIPNTKMHTQLAASFTANSMHYLLNTIKLK